MSVSAQPLNLQQGVAWVAGRPRLLISADYPYYRDDPAHWDDRLAQLQRLGLDVVTVYIPWRHHQAAPAEPPDFTGRTQPNRDVLGFLALCQARGLAVVAKPGPFIHGETNYGGLPDWTCPLNNTAIEPMQDAAGGYVWWSGARLDATGRAAEGWPLPAPYSAAFLALVRAWMARVGAEVIRPRQSPAGPIVAVQIGNEGIYSNGQHAPWAFDYSASGLAQFRGFLRARYATLADYNRQHGTAYADWEAIPAPRAWPAAPTPADWRAFMDWGAAANDYLAGLYAAWLEPLALQVPVVVNQNPPLREPFGLDAWLTRAEPERWPGVHYGFTNWVGDISANPAAYDCYLLTAKRYPGINWEENWGFAELYDPAYVDGATCFFQTLAILNAGATGFNIYTGAGTSFPDRNLEVLPKAPYPDAAPITHTGAWTPKAEIARWLTAFFERYGEDWLACTPVQPAAWALDLLAAPIAAWAPASTGPETPALGRHLGEFMRQMRALHLDYGVVNLAAAQPADLQRYPYLLAAGGPFMARAAQAKLAEYAAAGGRLALIGAVPTLDEALQPCDVLSAARPAVWPAVAAAEWLAAVERPEFAAGAAEVWVRSHPARDLHFVSVLIPTGGTPEVDLTLRIGPRRQRLQLSAAASGGAVLRVEAGRVTAALIKGHNGYRGCSVSPRGALDGQPFGAAALGDFLWIDAQQQHLPPS